MAPLRKLLRNEPSNEIGVDRKGEGVLMVLHGRLRMNGNVTG
jgi:hypothetical protein